MGDNKQKIIQSSLGSVFTAFSEEELKQITDSSRKVAISGKINNPGIIDIPEKATLKDIIDLAGGIIKNGDFKAAQLGIPFGGFLTEDSLNKELDFNLFNEDCRRTVIILSQEDCIVQYAKFYIDFLIGKMKDDKFKKYEKVKDEIMRMWKILDRISKGRSNMRDVFILRELASTVKETLNQKHNIMQEIIDKFYKEIEEHIEDEKCYTAQCNNLIKLTITTKCIGCGACKRVCPVDCIIGERKEQHSIDYNRCTHCGQCIASCPVDAITAGDNTLKFLRDLATPNKIVITQMAPAIRVAIGEAFGFEPGTNVEKKIAAALRKLGVDYVFDTTWAADLTIMEEAAELQERLEKHFAGDKDVKLPILTSCCPAWVKFIEQNYGDMLDVPSTAKSPMQMFATVAKDLWAKEEKGLSRDEVTSVAIMPCIAKKYEASRHEFSRGLNYDVDYVITTRELIKIFEDSGIDLKSIEDEEIDQVLGEYTGAGIIFGRTGGVIEAATRTAIENMTGEKLENVEFTCLRGWDSFRACDLEVGELKLRIGVAYGLKEAGKMLDKIRSKEEFFHAIEIMACPCGCVGGGGQPKAKKRIESIEKRAEGLNNIDRTANLRVSKENPAVQAIYERYLDKPLSHKAHELLHTKYFVRVKK
ncbi:[FeFe] hydrogenase, group A [Paraclostridium ghonii]|uniref:[FeFe] hydrogenase, group A n=1 Tax=Paraclostridium ghonii TaxID=29358 RepID=UPI00202CF5BA|nr:[FeFe] hydrogenase, group A [Paeniclostridium ghonii]MCM0165989.1 [FeFe] hydrogenase, group A [Paeniclostridium ghonii]